MDPKSHMLQDESKGLLQVDSKVESAIHVLATEGMNIEEDKSITADIGSGEEICSIHQIDGLNSTKKVDLDVEGVEKKDGGVESLEDKTYGVSLNDKVISGTRGDNGSGINVPKFENNDDHSWVDGGLLEEKSDQHHDTTNISGEYHLLFASTNEDWEESALFNTSNSLFMFDPLLEIESNVEPTAQLPTNEGVYIEGDKSVKLPIGLGDPIYTNDHVEDLTSTRQVDVELTRIEKKDEGVSFEENTHDASWNDEVTNEPRGDKDNAINVVKIDSKDGKSKMDGERGEGLEESRDKYNHTKDISDENFLLFAPSKEDWGSSLLNIPQKATMFDPLLQIESKVEQTIDVPTNEGVDTIENKFSMVEVEFGESIGITDKFEGLKSTKQVNVEVERVEEKDEDVLNFEDKEHVVYLDDNVISEMRGDRESGINVEKLENKDGISEVDAANGASLLEKRSKYHDIKDLNGENCLLFASKMEDTEAGSLVNNSVMLDYNQSSEDSGTKEEQDDFLKEIEQFHKNNLMEFKLPKFYGEGLNYLKLWRQVARLGGYDQVTSHKMWRQVGESFNPPRTCTTISWSFRTFYEKVLLEYEKYKNNNGKFKATSSTLVEKNACEEKVDGSNVCGRVRRESAARAMQSWHSKRTPRNGSVKRKRISEDEDAKDIQHIPNKRKNNSEVIDMGPPADWVKVNVLRTKDTYEVYALIPGLAREELRVQSDPAGRLLITGQPEQVDNPWGITRFKKVIVLPSRIDPSQTSASLNLHGRLYVSAAPEKPKSQ